MPHEAPELAAAVAALPVDELPCRGIDRDDAVELGQDGVLGRPEANRVRDRLAQRCVVVLELDRLPEALESRVRVEGLADRIDEPEAGAEVLVDGRARHGARRFIADIEAPSAHLDTPAHTTFGRLGFTRPYVRTHYARLGS